MSKTVKVRIAVAVNEKGDWCASGWNVDGDGPGDHYLSDTANHDVGGIVYFVEAEVPLPGSVTIQGKLS